MGKVKVGGEQLQLTEPVQGLVVRVREKVRHLLVMGLRLLWVRDFLQENVTHCRKIKFSVMLVLQVGR